MVLVQLLVWLCHSEAFQYQDIMVFDVCCAVSGVTQPSWPAGFLFKLFMEHKPCWKKTLHLYYVCCNALFNLYWRATGQTIRRQMCRLFNEAYITFPLAAHTLLHAQNFADCTEVE